MSQLTIEQIIELGDISVPLSANYQDKGKLFGERMVDTAPVSIAIVTDALRWQNDAFPNTDAANAVGSIEITSDATRFGMLITVLVDDPTLGIITLGGYTQQPGDTTSTIAQNLQTALSSNTYGYTISRLNDTVVIEARSGLGTLMNSGNRLIAILSNSIFDHTFDNSFN